jgi:hypothetical protein
MSRPGSWPTCFSTTSPLINLGLAEYGLDNAETALRYFQDALALCESSGDYYHEALACSVSPGCTGRDRPGGRPTIWRPERYCG